MNSDTSQKKRGSYLVVLQFALMLGFATLPVYPEPSGTELFERLATLRWLALALFSGSALILGTLGSYSIRKYLTPLPYPVENNQLVTTGIYSVLRHPLYSALLFAALGWSVFSMSISHLLLTVTGFLFFNFKASKEEKWLTERHPEYTAYARQVKKFIPWIY
ncbi:MAG: isoprenylcysteine carboxylmethyltransferase family protein [Chlorobiaceae bacterium]|nr:isoprenylcysteine carboxylmethyltransferase family protein [Chlorobiaceae bacterium]